MKIKFLMLAICWFMLGTIIAKTHAQDVSHCVVQLSVAPLSANFDPANVSVSTPATLVSETCFRTFAQAAAFVTNGRVNLPETATNAQISAAIETANRNLQQEQSRSQGGGGIQPQATYAIATVFDWMNHNYSGSSRTITGSFTCSSGAFSIPNISNTLGTFWNNRIESAIIYSPCFTMYSYDNTNYGGAWGYCNAPCYSTGPMNNKASSLIFTT